MRLIQNKKGEYFSPAEKITPCTDKKTQNDSQ